MQPPDMTKFFPCKFAAACAWDNGMATKDWVQALMQTN